MRAHGSMGMPGWKALPGLTALDLLPADRRRRARPVQRRWARAAVHRHAGVRLARGAWPGNRRPEDQPEPRWQAAELAVTGSSLSGISIRSPTAIAAPLTAPFSYVVRYHKPAEDEAAFIRNYVDTHPPTLGKLPGIRSVMCYFPQDMAVPALAAADYMIGNECVRQRRGVQNARCNRRCGSCRHFREFPVHRAQHAFSDEPHAAGGLTHMHPFAQAMRHAVQRFALRHGGASCAPARQF